MQPDEQHTSVAVDTAPRRLCEGCRTLHEEENMHRCSCGTWNCYDCYRINDDRCVGEFCDAGARGE